MKRIGVCLSFFLLLGMTSCIGKLLVDTMNNNVETVPIEFTANGIAYKYDVKLYYPRDIAPFFANGIHHLNISRENFKMRSEICGEEQDRCFIEGKKYYFNESITWTFPNNIEFYLHNEPENTQAQYSFVDGWYSFHLSNQPEIAYVISFDLSFIESYFTCSSDELIEEKEFNCIGNIKISETIEKNASHFIRSNNSEL